MRSFHEDALVHKRQSGFQRAEGISDKKWHRTADKLPSKCKHKRFLRIHVDSMAGIRCIPSKTPSLNLVHNKKKYNNTNLHIDGIYDPHIVYNADPIIRTTIWSLIVNSTCNFTHNIDIHDHVLYCFRVYHECICRNY